MDLEIQKEFFKDHVATFQDLGDIKILDFQRPGSCEYRIRFLYKEIEKQLIGCVAAGFALEKAHEKKKP